MESEVTSNANTPKGYTYVGKEDVDILKDLGWAILYQPQSSTTFGYIAAEAENEGPMQYSAYHAVSVTVESSISLKAEVMTTLGAEGLSKEFLGVSINISNVSENTGFDDITTTGTASANFNGKSYSTTLTSPDSRQPQFQEEGSTVTTGSIMLPPSELYSGATFPRVQIKGNFWNIKDDGSGATPLVYHGAVPIAKSYTQSFPAFTPRKK